MDTLRAMDVADDAGTGGLRYDGRQAAIDIKQVVGGGGSYGLPMPPSIPVVEVLIGGRPHCPQAIGPIPGVGGDPITQQVAVVVVAVTGIADLVGSVVGPVLDGRRSPV